MDIGRAHIAIGTNTIPRYRQPVYDAITRFCRRLTVVHHGQEVPNTLYRQETYERKSIGRITYGGRSEGPLMDADLTILMFDIQYANYLRTFMRRLHRGRPTLLWGHGLGRSWLGNRIRAKLANRASGVILYHERLISGMTDSGVDSSKIYVAHNSMAVDRPPSRDPHAELDTFVYVGRLQPRKRLDLLVRAFARLNGLLPRGHSVSLTILGDGEPRAQLGQLAYELGIGDKVRFRPGTFDPIQLRKLYQRAIAYVSPGHVGLGVVQSFGHGVPVVTFDHGGHAPEVNDIVDGWNGLLVPPTIDALADALSKLTRSPQLVRRMGEQAALTYERFDLGFMVQGLTSAAQCALAKV